MTEWWLVYWLMWAVVFGGITAFLFLVIVAAIFLAFVSAISAASPMTQSQRVLDFIREHRECTTMELQLALHPFVSNPRARISDLRAAGISIECVRRFDGRQGYVLREQPAQLEMAL